jgi:hypothetical protein
VQLLSSGQWRRSRISLTTVPEGVSSCATCKAGTRKTATPPGKSRFELTDLDICSRARSFGPTDLGEKGIESFFYSHVCNEYCHADGKRWASPRNPRKWFERSPGTSMISSDNAWKLNIGVDTKFKPGLGGLLEEDEGEDDW